MSEAAQTSIYPQPYWAGLKPARAPWFYSPIHFSWKSDRLFLNPPPSAGAQEWSWKSFLEVTVHGNDLCFWRCSLRSHLHNPKQRLPSLPEVREHMNCISVVLLTHSAFSLIQTSCRNQIRFYSFIRRPAMHISTADWARLLTSFASARLLIQVSFFQLLSKIARFVSHLLTLQVNFFQMSKRREHL